MKKPIKWLLIAVAVILAAALIYVGYVFITYNRIEDHQSLTPVGNGADAPAALNTEYTVVTQNCGFGAYTADFTFFMDGGKSSRAESRESVIRCIDGLATQVRAEQPNFVFYQEVDTDSTRSHHVNEKFQLCQIYDGFDSVFGVNYHSAYLMYPLTEPHGKSTSGILTFSDRKITGAERRSLPISKSFSKFLDLDRCYTISRVPVENGKELVLFNVHLSAYGGSDAIRSAQMSMLFEDLATEYAKGNYCVCGGDFNHDFTGDSTQLLNDVDSTDYGWAQPFPAEMLPDGIRRCTAYTSDTVTATCRNCDVPYDAGTFTVIVDGFLVSENVEVTRLENIDKGFTYSDHNPVVMSFLLK